MSPTTKRFDPSLYKANDQKARKAIKKLFKSVKGYTITDNSKKTAVDMLVYGKNGLLCNVELEIRGCWSGPDFPYNIINLPCRKEKYMRLEVPTLFLTFSKDTTHFLCMWDKHVLTCPKEIVKNKYCFDDEYFFKIKIEDVMIDQLPDFSKLEKV